MATMAAISGQINFSNFKSPCGPNDKFGQNELAFGRRYGLKIFKMAAEEAILDIRTQRF